MSKVIMFRGKAGTGKTTISDALSKRMGIVAIHKDDIYDTAAIFIQDAIQRNQICFDILDKLLESSLRCGADVIIDFGHNNLDDVERLKTWIEARNGTLKSILCVCDDSTWEERLRKRWLNPLPNQILTDITDLNRHYAKMRTGVLPDELVLDTTIGIEDLVEEAVKYVNCFM